MKKCKICGKEKKLKDFHFRSDSKKYRNECKDCKRKYNKINNKGKDHCKKWYIKNKEKVKKYNKKYYQEHKEEIKRKTLEYTKNKYKTDCTFRLSRNISRLLNLHIRKNNFHWETIIEYTLQELIEHLENTSEFTIKDYLEKDLHIDHIIPVSAYNFKSYKDEEFKKCWNLRNLRLTTAEENLYKSDKLDMELIEKYDITDLLP